MEENLDVVYMFNPYTIFVVVVAEYKLKNLKQRIWPKSLLLAKIAF